MEPNDRNSDRSNPNSTNSDEDDPLQYRRSPGLAPRSGVSPDIKRGDSLRRPPMVMTQSGQIVALAVGQEIQSSKTEVDVCFVFDTTGSMSDKIDGLVNCMTGFVDELAKLKLDWRTTCVPFGDLTVSGDRVDGQLPFVTTAESAKRQLRSMPAFNGGANQGESSIEAMMAGLVKPWRPDAVRVIVLLTDDYALGSNRSSDVDRRLGSGELICFVASIPTDYYKSWATGHGGRWFEIGPYLDTSALLNLLKTMVRDVALVARDVHQLAGGSVRRYLELDTGSKVRPLDRPADD
jgi:hypothetical protein